MARALLCVLAAVVVAGLVSTPQSTVVDDALRGLAVGATLLVPLVVLYVVARIAPRHRRYQRGNIRAAGLGLVLLVALAGYTLRCVHAPVLPPVVGCTPGATMCEHDAKMLCSSSKRWEPAGDEPCSEQGRVCAMVRGAAHCVVAADASSAGVGDASSDDASADQ